MGVGKLYVHELDLDLLNVADESDFETDLAGWEAQSHIAQQAFDAGYDAVKMFDEQGTCYAVNVKFAAQHMKMIDEING